MRRNDNDKSSGKIPSSEDPGSLPPDALGSNDFDDDFDDDDYAPTIMESPAGKGTDAPNDAVFDAEPEPEDAEFEDGFDDHSPTIMERPSEGSDDDDADGTDAPDFDDGFDDFSPTIMETPNAAPEEESDEFDDYSPTIMENPGTRPADAGSKDNEADDHDSLNIYDDFDDDDFAPTIMESPAADALGEKASSGSTTNTYEQFEADDDDFAPTIAERPGEKTVAPDSDQGETKTFFSITQHIHPAAKSLFSSAGAEALKDEIEVQKYQIGERIAEGGMGAIISASDLNIRRDVAMKVLLEGKQHSEDNVFRFIEEAQVTGQLEHPSIVPVYELGFNDQGEVFYSMKFVKGVTLKDILKKIRNGDAKTIEENPLPRLLTIYQKICDAMAFAHSKGVIHRDLKPENVMIGGFGEVLVMDWGLAKNIGVDAGDGVSTIRSQVDPKVMRGEGDREAPLDHAVPLANTTDTVTATRGMDSLFTNVDSESMNTMDGAIMGTPNFMAPEQATGQNEKMDARTDIYALGGILYNILTLRVPISGKSLTEMMVNIVRGNIPAPVTFNQPSRKPAGKGGKGGKVIRFLHCPNGKIPDALSAVTMKAMAVKQEERYQTVLELQKDIEAYQGGFATSAEEAGFLKLIYLLIMRHKLVSTILLGSLVVIAAISWVSYREVSERNIKLQSKNKEVEQQNIQLASQKVTLEEQKVTLENRKKDLESTIDKLEAEQRRTESERKAKELERKLKDQEREEKLAQMLAREEERKAKEMERELKEIEREEKLKEREEKLKERELRKKKEELAKQEQEKREEVQKTTAPEFVTKASALAGVMKWDAAMEAADTALDLDEFLSEAWYLKGWLLLGNLEFDEAVTAFERSIEKDPLGLRKLAKKFAAKKKRNFGELGYFDLKGLCKVVRDKNDFVLGDRLYQLTLENERQIIERLNKIKYELKRTNLELNDIHYQYTFSDNTISLDLSNNAGLRNIRALMGLPITHLNLKFTAVTDIRPLEGMPLQLLHLPAKQDNDPTLVLETLPLKDVHIHGIPNKNYKLVRGNESCIYHLHLYGFDHPDDYELNFLRLIDLSRTILHLHGAAFDDLAVFGSVAITRLALIDTVIKDLAPMQFKKLTYLDISGNDKIRDIDVIQDMPLKHLALARTRVKDVEVLLGKELEYLSLEDTEIDNIDVLRGMPLTFLNISGTKVTDFSVLRGMPLSELYIERMPIIDFSFLKGMQLRSLHMSETYASDIRVINGMPLNELDISGTRISNINMLERMPLTYLSLRNTPINDLSVLKGMPLRHLDISKTGIKNLSVLAGMPLNYLSLAHTDVTDISPLEGMPLKELSLQDCRLLKDVFPLSKCKNLYKLILPEHVETIHFLQKFLYLEYLAFAGDLNNLSQTTAQFWSQFDE